MSCCAHAGSANRFFSFFARRYHKKYLKKGLEKTQLQLVSGLTQAGYKQSTLLEIGSGVGYLHQPNDKRWCHDGCGHRLVR